MEKEKLNRNKTVDTTLSDTTTGQRSSTVKKQKRIGFIMVWQLVGLVIAFFFVIFYCDDPMGIIVGMMDYVSLFGLIGFALPMPLASGLWKDFLRAFRINRCTYTLHELKRCLEAVQMMQKQFLYSGLLAFFFQIVIVMWQYSRLGYNMEVLLSNAGISLLSIVYMLIAEAFLSALNIQVRTRLIDYMEEE